MLSVHNPRLAITTHLGMGLLMAGFVSPSVLAQNVTLDGTLGAPQTLTGPDYTIPQAAGQTVKQNLFQSFGRFNLDAGEKATFESAPEIRNIFSRVTGGEASQINGNIATQGQNTNLFLINPNGILFGPSARLDVSGSFVGTTANSINFADGTRFSANPAQSSPVLTVSVPLGLQFGSNPGPITVQSNGLAVKENKTLGLIGGGVTLRGGAVAAPSGNLEVGGVGSDSFVGVSEIGKGWRFDYAKVTDFRDIQLIGRSFILGSGISAGDIQVQGRRIGISESSLIGSAISGDSGQQTPGTIKVIGTESVQMDGGGGGSFIISSVLANGKGNGANIDIQTPSLLLQNGGTSIQSSTQGQGKAGNITINARDKVVLNGQEGTGTQIASLNSTTANGDVGGNIKINTNSLDIKSGGLISSSSLQGGTGSISINATGQVLVSGESVNGRDGPIPGSIGTTSQGGDAGNIDIQAGTLQIKTGGQVASGQLGNVSGSAGNITINARDAVVVDGAKSDTVNSIISITNAPNSSVLFPARDIRIKAGSLSVMNGASIATRALGRTKPGDIIIQTRDGVTVAGISKFQFQSPDLKQAIPLFSDISSSALSPENPNDAGRIQIDAKSLFVLGGARITSNTLGRGKAGDILISARDRVLLSGDEASSLSTEISSSALADSTGNGGSINIDTGSLRIEKGAELSAVTRGPGNAGNIIVNARDTTISDPSGIFTLVTEEATGKGGNILLKGKSLSIANGGVISSQNVSESLQPGNAGDISIQLSDRLTVKDGLISSSSERNSGGGISIKADSIRLLGDTNINTRVANGAGNGGDISLSANSILALNDSDILAFAQDGKGGNINLNTRAFLGQNFRPAPSGTDPRTLDRNNRADVNASGATSGIITLPDSDFIQNSFVTLSDNLINTETLLANSCIRREKKNGTFYITGSGNLPVAPGNPVPYTIYDTADVRPTKAAVKPTWKQGDAIVEPQGVFTLANGKRVMSRLCPGETVSNTSHKSGLGRRS